MRQPRLWKLSVTTLTESEDAVSEMLSALLEQAASSYADAESSQCTVTVYLRQPPAQRRGLRNRVAARLAQLQQLGLRLGPAKIRISSVARQDWQESWKRHFQPLEIGSKLLIKPSWSRRQPTKNQALIVIDPGLSFGTGQHPTTDFCLRQLAAHRRPEEKQSFLDLGTGSGILALAAARLGYQPVRALDFDPEAIRTARSNARRNRLAHRIELLQQDVTQRPTRPDARFSVVCANLLGDLLLAQRTRIIGCLAPRGILVLAGILGKEFPAVQRAYERAGLRLIKSVKGKEWQSGSFAWNSEA